nr:MAG TPA: hypothetical protein [Caudoviricetes sp.]
MNIMTISLSRTNKKPLIRYIWDSLDTKHLTQPSN